MIGGPARTAGADDGPAITPAASRRRWFWRLAAVLLLALAAVVTGWLAMSGARVLRPLVVYSVLLGLLGLVVLFHPVALFRAWPGTAVADGVLAVMAVALLTVTVVQTRPWEYTWWPGNAAATGTLDVCAVAPDVVRRLVPADSAGQRPLHRPAGEHRHCHWVGARSTTMSLSYQPFEARHLAVRFYALETSVYTPAGAPAPGPGDPGRFEVERVAEGMFVKVVVRRANVVVSVNYYTKGDGSSAVDPDRAAADVVALARAATAAFRLG